jgi:hypothetical protein
MPPFLHHFAAEAVYALSLAAGAWVRKASQEGMNKSGSGLMANLWCCFMEVCFLFHPSKSAPAALLLTSFLLQLTVSALQHSFGSLPSPLEQERAFRLLWAPVATFSGALAPSCHPGLLPRLPSRSSMSPAQLERCNANIVAALQQQVGLLGKGWQGLRLHILCALS